MDFGSDMVYLLPKESYSAKYRFLFFVGHRQGGAWRGKDVAIVLWLP